MTFRSKYMTAYQDAIVENLARNKVIAELIKEGYTRGYHVIVLLERIRHLKLVSDQLRNIPHRIVAEQYEGRKITVKSRQTITKKFEASNVRVILANKVFKKGVNVKRVDVIISASASKSKDSALQE